LSTFALASLAALRRSCGHETLAFRSDDREFSPRVIVFEIGRATRTRNASGRAEGTRSIETRKLSWSSWNLLGKYYRRPIPACSDRRSRRFLGIVGGYRFPVTRGPVNLALTRARFIKMRCLEISYRVKMESTGGTFEQSCTHARISRLDFASVAMGIF
jgi:hypothetical protein